LVYQVSRDGYDATKMTNIAINYPFTLSVIKSNHGKAFGAYTPVQWRLIPSSHEFQKMKEGHRSFVYFFDG
jgi:hypothetical protein